MQEKRVSGGCFIALCLNHRASVHPEGDFIDGRHSAVVDSRPARQVFAKHFPEDSPMARYKRMTVLTTMEQIGLVPVFYTPDL